MERWQYVTDIHGDLLCEDARSAAFKFRDKFKPEVRIIGGDLFDLRALRNGASQEEKEEGILDDVEAGLKFLRDYDATHLLLGNHDYRLVEKAEKNSNGVMRDYCRLLLDKIQDECYLIDCKIYPYDVVRGVLKYGNYKFIHGYCHNIHSAHKAGQAYGNVVMGHVHTFQEASPERDDCPTAYTCGMMADPERMGYARRRQGFLRWKQGFMYGWKTDEDRLIIQTVKKDGPEWIYPTKFNK